MSVSSSLLESSEPESRSLLMYVISSGSLGRSAWPEVEFLFFFRDLRFLPVRFLEGLPSESRPSSFSASSRRPRSAVRWGRELPDPDGIALASISDSCYFIYINVKYKKAYLQHLQESAGNKWCEIMRIFRHHPCYNQDLCILISLPNQTLWSRGGKGLDRG